MLPLILPSFSLIIENIGEASVSGDIRSSVRSRQGLLHTSQVLQRFPVRIPVFDTVKHSSEYPRRISAMLSSCQSVRPDGSRYVVSFRGHALQLKRTSCSRTCFFKYKRNVLPAYLSVMTTPFSSYLQICGKIYHIQYLIRCKSFKC